MTTPSVKRTATTESLVELESERRAVHRRVVAKLLHMCQERADIMFSVKETARKITCPTERRRNKREAHREIPEKCSERKALDSRINKFPPFVKVYTVTGQATTC